MKPEVVFLPFPAIIAPFSSFAQTLSSQLQLETVFSCFNQVINGPLVTEAQIIKSFTVH